MSRDLATVRTLTTIASAGWAVTILVLYVVWRPDDVQPVLMALSQRALDLSVPIGLWLVHLPLGSWILARFVPHERGGDSLEWLIRASAIGLGVAMLTTTVGAVAGCVGAMWIAVTAASCALGSLRQWPSTARQLVRALVQLREELRSVQGAAVLVVLGLSLVTALTPAVSQDALHYHLEVPKRWLEAGGFTDVPGNVYSRFPMNLELLFLNGLALRGEIAAKVWHWWFAVLAAGALRLLAGRFATKRAAMWAPAIFLAVPSVFRVATWAYVELGLIYFLLVGWDLLVDSKQRGADAQAKSSVGLVVLAGLCFGVACGIKYTALPIALAAAIAVAIQTTTRRAWTAGLFAASAAVGGGFWYLKNWVEVGNPVYPFLYSFFGGSGWDLERSQLFQTSLEQWGEVSWGLPFSLTFDATFASIERFDGIVGPALLIALPLLGAVAWRQPKARPTFAFAAFMIGLWLTTTQQIRFLLPGLAVLFALVPIALESTVSINERRVYVTALVGCISLSFVSHFILFGREAPVAYAVGLESAESNRARRLPGGDSALFARIGSHVAEDERILFAASGNPVFLCERPYHADSVVENYTLRTILKSATAAECAARFAEQGFTHLLFRFELVFGEPNVHTDLSLEEQQRLMKVINDYGSLSDSAGGTFLYRVGAAESNR